MHDRAQFKRFEMHMISIGLIPFSLSLILDTQLIVARIIGDVSAVAAAGSVAVLLGAVWWLFPLAARRAWRTLAAHERPV